MLIKQLLEVYDVLDDSNASGETVEAYLREESGRMRISRISARWAKGKNRYGQSQDSRKQGKTSGGDAPTLGLLGRLGGLGARPGESDSCLTATAPLSGISLAAKLLDMQNKGRHTGGVTSLYPLMCVPDAPTRPHKPVALWIHLWRWPRSTRKS